MHSDLAPPVTTADHARPSPEALAADIPLTLAIAAHAGTSWTPERRGEQEQRSYANALLRDYDALARNATTDEKRALLAAEFARYRTGYRRRTLVSLAARGRCISSMITGPSNFPTARNAKSNAASDKRMNDLAAYRVRALSAIIRALTPELQPIMAGDADAIARLRTKLQAAEARQLAMKNANAVIRAHAKSGATAQAAALVALGHSGAAAHALLQPDGLQRVGFPDYELTNNAANIRRMRSRLEELTVTKATPDSSVDAGDGIRIEDSPTDNRVRIYFPGKPAADIRTALKAHGFRWAPSLGCWQAYRNTRSLDHANSFSR